MPKTEPNNTRHWDALSKTDPKHTKPFKRSGGFSGTALKPMWIVKRMTEEFGPIGEGWGTTKPEFEVVEAGAEILVYCTVGVWHTDTANLFYGVGGDKVTAKRNAGSFNSDEAFKMAYTDAVNNALKYVGVGGDIHMGQFDDSKYLAEVTEEFKEQPPYMAGLEAFMLAVPKCTTQEQLAACAKEHKADLDAAAKAKDSKRLIAGQVYIAKAEEFKSEKEPETEPAE